MIRKAKAFLQDERGDAAAEVTLMVAVIGVAMAAAAGALGSAVNTRLSQEGDVVASIVGDVPADAGASTPSAGGDTAPPTDAGSTSPGASGDAPGKDKKK